MRIIRNFIIEIIGLALLLDFYLSTDVYNGLYGTGRSYKIQLLVYYNKESAENLNVYFIQLFVLFGFLIASELVLWCIKLVKRKKNKK